MSMRIDDNILSQIYLSQNYGAQPLESEEKKVKDPKAEGQKTEGDKSLEDRSVFQVNGKEYNLTSADFRVALYEYAKRQGSLEKELATIRQRLGLTDKGEALAGPNKALDTRSVINSVFARPENVQAKVDAALMGVVKFPKDVRTEIHHAIWRQRDNPGIRKFLQSGGSSQDLAAICRLTLDSMKEHSRKSFADRMVMSYLKGFTLGTISSSIAFSTEFEKSFEGDQVIREERKGVEDRRTVELKSLEVATEEALTELEDKTQSLLPKSDEKESTVGDRYLKEQYDDVKKELQRFCESRKTKLESADAEGLKVLVNDDFKKDLDKKVSKGIKDMNDFHQRAKQLDLLAKSKYKPDDYLKTLDKGVYVKFGNDKDIMAYYQALRNQFLADYKEATGKAAGTMWPYLSDLKGGELTADLFDRIYSGSDYCADFMAFVKAELKDKGKEIGNYYDDLRDPKDFFTADKKNELMTDMFVKQQKFSNTCYMTSFVNGLLMKEEGVTLLKGCVLEKKEDENDPPVFKFKGKDGAVIEIKRSDIEAQKLKEGFKKDDATYADFEWAVHIAQFKNAKPRNPKEPGLTHMQDQLSLAKVFGYEEVCSKQVPKGGDKGVNMMCAAAAWVEAKQYAETWPDAIVTVKSGGDNAGHYMTVTDFYKTEDDFGVIVLDSLGRAESVSLKNHVSELSLHVFRTHELADAENAVKGPVENFARKVKEFNAPLETQREAARDVLREVFGEELLKDLEKVFLGDEADKFGNVSFNVSQIVRQFAVERHMDANTLREAVTGLLNEIEKRLQARGY